MFPRTLLRLSYWRLLVVAVVMAIIAVAWWTDVFAIQSVPDNAATAYDAELSFAAHSPLGSDGGSVIPASCDSGVLHWPGDLDACPSGWVTYCSGALPGDPNGQNWQWWRYYDSAGGRIHRFVSEGYGTCTPDAPSSISYECSPDGLTATTTWTASYAAEAYYPRIQGITVAQCSAMGWNWWTDGAGTNICYKDAWNATSMFTYVGSGFNRVYVHSGPPVNWNKFADTGWFQCPTATALPAPTPTYSCSGDGTQVTVNWNEVAGATEYHPRLLGITEAQCNAISGGVGWFFDASSNSCAYNNLPASWGTPPRQLTFNLRPGGYQHAFWVHASRDAIPETTSPAGSTGYFSCLPAPTNLSGSCSADGTEGTITWTAPAGYTTFYTRASAVAQGRNDLVGVPNTTDDPWDDNVVGTSKSFTTDPGETYYVWIHTKNTTNGTWSDPARTQFTCPDSLAGTPPPSPRLNSAICRPDPSDPSVGLVTLSWEREARATSYDVRARWINPSTETNPAEACPNGKYSTQERWCWNSVGQSFTTGYSQTNDTASFSFSGLPLDNNKNYTWWVHSRNAAGSSNPPSHANSNITFTCAVGTPPEAGDPPAVLALTATPSLILPGRTTTLNYRIEAPYDMDCTITGGDSSYPEINYRPTPSLPVTGAGIPYLEDTISSAPIVATTNFVLSCDPVPNINPPGEREASVRVEIVPTFEER